MIADRFEIVALAGAGGMGEVWKARDRLSGAAVAVKISRCGESPPSVPPDITIATRRPTSDAEQPSRPARVFSSALSA